MAWCCQATSHYLNQCWPTFIMTYGTTRPQWFKLTLTAEVWSILWMYFEEFDRRVKNFEHIWYSGNLLDQLPFLILWCLLWMPYEHMDRRLKSFYPSALRAGGVLSSRSGRANGRVGGRAGGRLGGRLPNLRNPYLCNRLMDFLNSKLCGIV